MTETKPADVAFEPELPARRRIKFLTPWTAALMALILGGVGFYVGVRVEKSKTTSGGSGLSALAQAFSGAGGTSTTGSSGAGAGGFAARFGGGAGARSGGGGFAGGGGFSGAGGGFAGARGGAAGSATIGQVSNVDGDTIYVTTTSRNTVKVKLSSSTTITKSESVSNKKLFPGDTIVVQGAQGSKGTVTAISVTDSGARNSGGGSSSSSTPSSGGASSAISSLFGGG